MFEPLQYSHKNSIEEKIKKFPSILSDYFFPNLYLYRNSLGTKIHEGTYSLIETNISSNDNLKVYMPLDLITPESLLYYKGLVGPSLLYPISDEGLSLMEVSSKEYKEADSDYLFTLEKISFLKGGHLSAKRNLLYRFFDLYEDREVIELASHNILLAKEVLEGWSKEHGSDYSNCLEALEMFEELDLYGRLLIIKKKPVGFIIGGRQGEVFIVQFMKADKDYKGIYTFLYQDLALALPKNILWINLEEDLGIPSLRQAKRSYQPDQIARKWRVKL